MDTLPIVGTLALLAVLDESMVEYAFGQIFDRVPGLAPYKWLQLYIALLIGVGLALHYQLDLVATLAQELGAGMTPTPVGYIITGLVIGRGSAYLHDLVGLFAGGKLPVIEVAPAERQ